MAAVLASVVGAMTAVAAVTALSAAVVTFVVAVTAVMFATVGAINGVAVSTTFDVVIVATVKLKFKGAES